MSLVYQVRKDHLADVLGLKDELGGDETVISTINVRLGQMFREAIQHLPNLVILAAQDMEKLVRWGPVWKSGSMRLETRAIKVTPKSGLTDKAIQQVNDGPEELAHKLAKMPKRIFCHTPMLKIERIADQPFVLTVWIRVIALPEEIDAKESE